MKVRKGSTYRVKLCLLDIADRRANTPENGTLVRVCHPHGCPPPNAMGHCHVETLDGEFIGLVATASLEPVRKRRCRLCKAGERHLVCAQ